MIRAWSRQMPSLAFLITSMQSSAASLKIHSQEKLSTNQSGFSLIDLSFFAVHKNWLHEHCASNVLVHRLGESFYEACENKIIELWTCFSLLYCVAAQMCVGKIFTPHVHLKLNPGGRWHNARSNIGPRVPAWRRLIIVLVMNIESQPSLIYDPRAVSRKQASWCRACFLSDPKQKSLNEIKWFP